MAKDSSSHTNDRDKDSGTPMFNISPSHHSREISKKKRGVSDPGTISNRGDSHTLMNKGVNDMFKGHYYNTYNMRFELMDDIAF